MAYDQELAERIRAVLPDDSQLAEKEMFGGICFLRAGSMFCGIIKEDLMLRVGPDAYDAALENVHAREMDFTGRPMKGYVMVEPEGFRTAAALSQWVQMGYQFVTTKLKPKKTAANRSPSKASTQNKQALPKPHGKKNGGSAGKQPRTRKG